MERTQDRLDISERTTHRTAVGTLLAFHFFGFLGMHSEWMRSTLAALTPFEGFAELTPLNLVLTTGILLYFHGQWNAPFWRFAFVCFATGYLAEVAGVQTGAVFGQYAYGETMGPKLFGVPPLIGANWLVLVYCCSALSLRLKLPTAGRVLFASALMVLLDLFIEPVAMRFGMWDWGGGQVPLQNYLAWYGISAALCWLFLAADFDKRNPLAGWVYGVQLAFFAAHVVYFQFGG